MRHREVLHTIQQDHHLLDQLIIPHIFLQGAPREDQHLVQHSLQPYLQQNIPQIYQVVDLPTTLPEDHRLIQLVAPLVDLHIVLQCIQQEVRQKDPLTNQLQPRRIRHHVVQRIIQRLHQVLAQQSPRVVVRPTILLMLPV